MKYNIDHLQNYGVNEKDIILEGYILKRGNYDQSYQRRWFVLKGNALFYFKSRQHSVPQGFILLLPPLDIKKCFENGKPTLEFTLQTSCTSADTVKTKITNTSKRNQAEPNLAFDFSDDEYEGEDEDEDEDGGSFATNNDSVSLLNQSQQPLSQRIYKFKTDSLEDLENWT
eukprot:Pgem_evm1s4896